MPIDEPRFDLLGTPTFSVGGESALLPDTVPSRLVALLALRGTAIARTELAGLLYPDEPDGVALQRVRLQLSRARKLHARLPLKASKHYASCVAVTDVQELLSEVGDRDWAGASKRAAPRLLAAWELTPALTEALQPLENQLKEAWLLAIRRRAQDLLSQADSEAAVALLLRALAEEPMAEDVVSLLLRAAGEVGSPQVAERAYREFSQAIEPMKPTSTVAELYERLYQPDNSGGLEPLQVARAAAVLGEQATVETIALVVNAPASSVVRVLAELERAGTLGPESQALDPAALLDPLTQVERRFLHGQAARALSYAGLPFQEGEQWLLAGDYERAVAAWFPATTDLFSREVGRHDEALEFYQRILALPVRSPAWYAASAYYALLQLLLGDTEGANARVDEVLEQSRDPVARTFAFTVRARLELISGNGAAAVESARLAEAQAKGADSLALQRDVALTRLRILGMQGQSRAALDLAADLIEGLRLEPPRLALLSCLAEQAALLCNVGDFGAALASYREQLQLARQLGFARDEVRVVADILATLNDMGRAGEDVELGFQALELGEFDVTWPLRFNLAEALTATGRVEEAIEQVDTILAGAASVSTKGHSLALRLRLAGPGNGVLQRAFELARSTDLVPVRVAIASAAAGLSPAPPRAEIVGLLQGIEETQVPAWQAQEWRALAPLLGKR